MIIGTTIFHNKRVKKITRLPRNTREEVFIIWESLKPSYQTGGVTVQLWNEWIQESKDEDKKLKEESMYLVKRRKRRGVTRVKY